MRNTDCFQKTFTKYLAKKDPYFYEALNFISVVIKFEEGSFTNRPKICHNIVSDADSVLNVHKLN
jgi:hypothetical protein